MCKRVLVSLFFLGIIAGAFAQLSQGGLPREIYSLKSASSLKYVELSIPESALIKADESDISGNHLKPFRFAHTIPVNFTPENSGKWFEMDDYRIWQLALHSAGAKTLNLIFNDFHIPDGARLFLFSEDQSDMLGAFTSQNNKADKKFATSPVIGDKLIIQYEEPLNVEFDGEIAIKSVNHDFVGIKSTGDVRRPRGESGLCNVNINCDYMEQYRLAANSVCRILISGKDLCTGTLMNNTKQDQTPYVYTAGHCIDDATKASESVFLFNYESPYCGSIDGEVNHSLSSSSLKAQSDSLDFSLVELSIKPPKSFRPYYLGWDNSGAKPDSSVCIHHPNGDIKKISIDRHSPFIKTYNKNYIKNAFYLIGNWEEGTTEGGSSGSTLINPKMRMVGSLTGGYANCELPVNDYFAMFSFAWDYYSSSSKQLKAWLDPTNSNAKILDGMNPYDGTELCGAFTNFADEDTHENLEIDDQGTFKGYWGGSNDYGFTSFAEKFTFQSDCEVTGISLGVAKAVSKVASNSMVRIDVYDGINTPGNLLYSQEYRLRDIDEGVMNYFDFSEPVQTDGNFFIAYSIDNVLATDTFSVYLAKRVVDPRNSLFIKDGQEWYAYSEKSGTTEGSAILIEAILCNIDTTLSDLPLKNNTVEVKAYPNPFKSGQELFVEFEEPIQPKIVQVFDLMGRQVEVSYRQLEAHWLNFDFTGRRPGIYFLKIVDIKTTRRYHIRVSYLGNN